MTFDARCPRKLSCPPDLVCPLAVQRLKALAQANRNAPYSKERAFPGCPFYVLNKEANYCFFQYIVDNDGRSHSIIEICELLCVTQAAIYESLRRGIAKLKRKECYKLLNLKKNKL